MKYNRSVKELKDHAKLWWSKELRATFKDSSVIPLLLESQDDFLSILCLAKKSPFQVFSLIESANFQANLFVKHLTVLVDYGGEPLQRLGREFTHIFTRNSDGNYYFDFIWNNEPYTYEFETLPIKGLGNSKLSIDATHLINEKPLSGLYKDIIMILMFASESEHSGIAGLEGCNIGGLLGSNNAIKEYVKQRYLIVSRITGGYKSNALGQLLQKHALKYFKENLGKNYQVYSNRTIILDNYNKSTGMPFDIVVVKGNKKVGIEISFQVTTNSTIERKSGQAESRQKLMNEKGYYIGYIIDGAGNFQRESALRTICEFSDCTVAYSEEEFDVMCRWIKEIL